MQCPQIVPLFLVLGLPLASVLQYATAFVPTTSTRSLTKSIHRQNEFDFSLGPVARNGLAYEEITVGQGRRILPGDTVYCFYEGSFTTSEQKNAGPFGGFLGGGSGDSTDKKTVFDEVSKLSTRQDGVGYLMHSNLSLTTTNFFISWNDSRRRAL